MRKSAIAIVLVAAACGRDVVVENQFAVEGALDRESIFGEDASEVLIAYRSETARGEWWPCDLRLTAGGCVDDHHVNVFITRADAEFTDVGSGACFDANGDAQGVLQALFETGQGTYAIGADFNAFVVIASDTDDTPGADFESADETTAAAAISSGSLEVIGFAGESGITLALDGQTREGREVRIEFAGPTSVPAQVTPLDGPESCVAGALVTP